MSSAERAAIAQAYLESDREVLAAIWARPEWAAILLHVPNEVRVHYTAAIVVAVRSVLDARAAR